MRVEEIMSLQDYDTHARTRWPHRIPNVQSTSLQDRLGDCIYDYSGSSIVQRAGVHGADNIATDLRGENVLISKDFYYFGSRARKLPDYLLPICHQTQGHRSNLNAPYFDQFVSWLRSLVSTPGQLYGWPDHIVEWDSISACGGCISRKLDDELAPDC